MERSWAFVYTLKKQVESSHGDKPRSNSRSKVSVNFDTAMVPLRFLAGEITDNRFSEKCKHPHSIQSYHVPPSAYISTTRGLHTKKSIKFAPCHKHETFSPIF